MTSSAWQGRRIASNYLFTGRELLADPLVEVGVDGVIQAVKQCAAPDRCAGVEFYAGILTPGLIDACCEVLTDASVLCHRNAGTVAAGTIPAESDLPTVPGFGFRSLGARAVLLSQLLAGQTLPEDGVVIIDQPLNQSVADRILSLSEAGRWCLCPCAVGLEALPGTLDILRRYGIVPALGSYAPGMSEIVPLAECLLLFAGEPVREVLMWGTERGAQLLGLESESGVVISGRHSGLNLLSGLDYPSMCLTRQMRLTRIL